MILGQCSGFVCPLAHHFDLDSAFCWNSLLHIHRRMSSPAMRSGCAATSSPLLTPRVQEVVHNPDECPTLCLPAYGMLAGTHGQRRQHDLRHRAAVLGLQAGRVPLHVAAMSGNLKALQRLLAAGARRAILDKVPAQYP